MPVYEYACKSCGHEFEREQRISDKPVKKCPDCGALQAKRLISRTSFVLKGSGWYNDLYSSRKPEAAKPKESSGESGDGGGSAGGKADSPAGEKAESAASKPAETSKPASSDKPKGKPKGPKAAA